MRKVLVSYGVLVRYGVDTKLQRVLTKAKDPRRIQLPLMLHFLTATMMQRFQIYQRY